MAEQTCAILYGRDSFDISGEEERNAFGPFVVYRYRMSDLLPVLKHNAMDLMTMAELAGEIFGDD